MGEGGRDGDYMQIKFAKKNAALVDKLQDNIQELKRLTGKSTDIIFKEMTLELLGGTEACVMFIDGLSDSKSVNDFILESLLLEGRTLIRKFQRGEDPVDYLKQIVLTAVLLEKDAKTFDEIFGSLLSGEVILLIDGSACAITVCMREWKERSITEPTSEIVIRGPKEGFTENLRTNTAMIRRKIKSPNLWLESSKIGKITQTDVDIMFINGIADEKIVEEVRSRLKSIDIDGILESGYIEDLIQDDQWTPFPTVYNTERPDVIAAELLEGKVAIVVDGTPFVLVVPALFVSFMHSAEDYYHRWDISTAIRILRLIGIMIGLLGPSLYVAITAFHREMIPRQLLVSLAAQREGLPFPAFVEAIIMEAIFEILREASIRMPRNIGQAMSIVGSIVLGTAAVQAGFVSPAMVIVVSITAIATFVIPSNDMSASVRLLRFPFIILATTFGVFGIILGLIALALHLASLRSFGVPYLSPIAPFNKEGYKDTILRVPIKFMFFRPKLIARGNIIRRGSHRRG